jgi:hypothetical protein
MKMAGRIRSSWTTLSERLPTGRLDSERSIRVLQAWLRDEVASVSKLAAAALAEARGVALLVAAEPEMLPLTRVALAGFAGALCADPPVDPRAYVRHVDKLCWKLVLFTREDDSCPVCQGDLGVWTDGHEELEVCDLLGCCFDARGRQCSAPPGLRPATRAQVLRRHPRAPLAPLPAPAPQKGPE